MSAPTAADITLRQTLELLDGPFATLASAVAEDRYAFWLGSGISLGRVHGLRKLVSRVLDHLQKRVAVGDPGCRFRALLGEIMTLASLTPAERASIDVDRPIADWPPLESMVEHLIGNYARLLDLAPSGEEADYLLWDGVDVRATYADPTTEPDSEHLCLALLVLEGVVSEMPSANWDGLIESAIDHVAPGQASLLVCVVADDLRQQTRQTTLYKFHGCAVRARDDAVQYRQKLVGRASQINGWRTQHGNRPIVNRLVDLATTKRTLMLGLSAQDGNIQNVFAEAEANMSWEWPIDPPAYAFSEDHLGIDQKGLLQIVYRSGYTVVTREDIFAHALIRAYAKPLLAALVLHVVFSKLERLLFLLQSALPQAERLLVAASLRQLRDRIADAMHPPASAIIFAAIRHLARFMAMFHEGDATSAAIPYRPITSRSIQHIGADPATATAGMRELAVAVGLTSIGIHSGYWIIETIEPHLITEGAFKMIAGGRNRKFFIVANSTAATRLMLKGHVKDDDDAIVIHALEIAPAMARSPRPIRSRRGAPGVCAVSIAGLLSESTAVTVTAIMQRMREEISA